MSIHIKDQHAGVINNVDGDQVVYGGQYGTVVTSQDARRAVHDLRDALAGTALDDATAAEARARVGAELAAVDKACSRFRPTSRPGPGVRAPTRQSTA